MAWPGWVPTELVQAIRADGGYPLDIGSMEHQLFIKCLNGIIHADDWGVHGTRRVFVDFLFDRAGLFLRGSGQSRVDPPPDRTDSPLMRALTVLSAFFLQCWQIKRKKASAAGARPEAGEGKGRERKGF